MAPLEPWEKVFLNLGDKTFEDIDPNHGKLVCEDCHGGVGLIENVELSEEPTESELNQIKETAHSADHGFVIDPAAQENSPCQVCHYELTERSKNSMHTKAWGERYKVALRAEGHGDFDALPPDLEHGFTEECGSCHATCGECHISRPNSVGGGFVERHKFRKPHMQDNCTACHGTRIGDDYFGNLQGNTADTHFQSGFQCMDCHNEDFHGTGNEAMNPPRSRYEVEGIPQCVDCHANASASNDYHTTHWAGEGSQDDLDCYVCHSQPYNSCNSCHTNSVYREGYGETDTPDVFTGAEGYKEFPSFKIGKNPAYQDAGGPWSPAMSAHPESEWVLLRHIPVVEDTYYPWDWQTLEHYDKQETWQYTSPHNIQRWTAQTLVDTTAGEPCGSNCHHSAETDSLYLTLDYLEAEYPEEISANEHVIAPY